MKISIVKWLLSGWRRRQERLEREKANIKRWERLLGLADSEDSWRNLDEGGGAILPSRPEPYLQPEPTEHRDSGHSGRIDNTPRLKGDKR